MTEWLKHANDETRIINSVVRWSYRFIKDESFVRKGLDNVKTDTTFFVWKYVRSLFHKGMRAFVIISLRVCPSTMSVYNNQ
jgi:hypothetical protein